MATTIDSDVIIRRWRRVEYDRLVDLGMFEGERLELLAGHLVVREPLKSLHASTVAQAAHVLEAAFGRGFHARTQLPVALDEDSEPEPDVVIVTGRPFDYVDAHPSSAALLVEVADSSLRLDRRLKTPIYARARVADYWIVNLVDRVVEIYRDPQADSSADLGAVYRSVEILRAPALVSPLAAPAARIAVSDLLP
jgi:Uma2 family endonuclease